VGAFYTRFADKEALVRCLLARFHEQAVATAAAVLVPERWESVGVEDALETMILFMLRILRERRALILALMQRAPNDAELTAYGRRLHEAIAERMHVLLERRGHTVMHADPETGVRVAVWLVLSAMESRALYADSNVLQLPDEVVAREMAQMVVRYVGVDSDDVASTTGRAIANALRLPEGRL
jgi:AcrR family transcriptional regulator